MRSCNNWRGKVCSKEHAIRVLVSPRIRGVARQRAILHWCMNPDAMWRAYAARIRCHTERAVKAAALVAMLLTIEPKFYHVTFDPSMDEVELIIWSDSNEEPYFAVQSVDVERFETSVDIPRHPLPPGSYILKAQVRRWEGCPTRCESVVIDGSPTVIIKEREK